MAEPKKSKKVKMSVDRSCIYTQIETNIICFKVANLCEKIKYNPYKHF